MNLSLCWPTPNFFKYHRKIARCISTHGYAIFGTSHVCLMLANASISLGAFVSIVSYLQAKGAARKSLALKTRLID